MLTEQRKPRVLPIVAYQQRFAYSCVAAILQTVYHYHTGQSLSHKEAVRLTGCDPDGATLRKAASVLKRLCGTGYRDVGNLAGAKRALRSGKLVISNDNRSWIDPHAVLFCGATKRGVYVYDPNTADTRWRHNSWVKKSDATEFIVINSPTGRKLHRA